MRKVFLPLLIGISLSASAQSPTPQQVNNLLLLGKIWGFIKYYHPALTSGKIDWDEELIKFLPNYEKTHSDEERDDSLLAWIDRLGDIPECNACSDSSITNANARLRPDFSWIDHSNFSQTLRSRLKYLIHNRNVTGQYYVKFISEGSIHEALPQHEKMYPNISYPDPSFGLLSLFRFWNVIEYWYPYKYNMRTSWDSVLKKFIPRMRTEDNPLQYGRDMEEMLTSIEDSHGFIINWPREGEVYGRYLLPVTLKCIEGKWAVTTLLNDSLVAKAGIRIGDKVDSIDGRATSDIAKELSLYCPASNDASRINKLSFRITKVKGPQSRIAIGHNSITVSNFIPKLFPPIDLIPPYFSYPKDSGFCRLPHDIVYLNMGKVNRKDSTRFKEMIAASKGLIIDNRQNADESYGTNAADIIGNLILPPNRPFIRFSSAQRDFPGVFTLTKPDNMGVTGSNDHYPHKIAILINENTTSVGEFISMAYKTAPGATLIGTPTAGADGNVSYLYLPGAIMIQYTGLGVYYPDDRETQRIGIQPDIRVPQTWAGFQSGKDEQLEKAIEWARP